MVIEVTREMSDGGKCVFVDKVKILLRGRARKEPTSELVVLLLPRRESVFR